MSEETDMIGESLLHYRIGSKLGSGGMGEVYRARDTKLDRDVALKLVPEHLAEDPKRLARFEREAKAVAALNHPNIVTIHSIEQDGATHFLTMELVEGQSLDQLVPPEGLPATRVLEVATPLADALAAAHERGIIHRDLKPGNVMITKDGRVKVLDFGLAKLLEVSGPERRDMAASQLPTDTLTLTGAGTVVGTVPYLSPEYLDGQDADHRSDIFSLGIVLYEMVTGLLPFEGTSGPSMMSSILRDTPRSVSDIRPATPPPLARIIGRCLEKDPQQRYQSAADLATDLQDLSLELLSGSGWRPRPWRPRLPWRAVAAVAVALSVGVGGAWVWLQRESPAAESTPISASTASSFDASQWVIAVIASRTLSAADSDVVAINDGLASTLTTKLAQLSRGRELQVIPSSLLREHEIGSLEAARTELGVTLALNLDTRQLGDRIRVNTQLVDIPNQRQLLAETIDGEADDLLALEERVTARVLQLLRVELQPMERTLLSAGTRNSEAFNFYLRGQGFLQEYQEPANVEQAARMFERALQADPDFAQAHAGLGQALWLHYGHTNDLRWVDAAFESCRRAVEIDELGADGHACLGILYNGTGRYEDAIDEFKIANSLDPTRDLVLKGLADAYQSTGDPELAEEIYKEAIAARPHYWAPHNWLGIFYHRQGRAEEALASFEQVERLAPDCYLGPSNTGAALYFMGRFEEAEASFERALEIYPQDDVALNNLGTIYFFQGRFEESIERFQQAVELNDRDYFNWGNLADAYRWSETSRERAPETYRRAISLCEEQLLINPSEAVVLADMAYYLAMQGAKEPARRAIERSLELLPSDIDVQHRAVQVYTAVGDEETALLYLDRALASGYPRQELAADPLLVEFLEPVAFQRLLESRG